MTVDLLVVNYNTKDKLKRLLDTLHEDYLSSNIEWKLYVADNGSEDGSYQWLKENRDNYNIETVFKNPNVGYSAAVNAMANVSESDILAAVNADTWFSSVHVEAANRSFKDHPNQAIMGPKQLDEKGIIRHGGIFWNGDKSEDPVHRGWNQADFNDVAFHKREQCWTVSGSLYYVRRSVWDEMTNHPVYRELHPRALGAALETFMYFEETFTSVFAQHLGYEVWYDGTIPTAGHSWHASNNPGDNVHHFHNSKVVYVETCDKLGINHEIKERNISYA